MFFPDLTTTYLSFTDTRNPHIILRQKGRNILNMPTFLKISLFQSKTFSIVFGSVSYEAVAFQGSNCFPPHLGGIQSMVFMLGVHLPQGCSVFISHLPLSTFCSSFSLVPSAPSLQQMNQRPNIFLQILMVSRINADFIYCIF